MGLGNSGSIHVREEVAQRFMAARDAAQRIGYDLIAYDGWRSIALQEELYWHYLEQFTAREQGCHEKFRHCSSPQAIRERFLVLPTEQQQRLHAANRRYVSWPSSDPLRPSPHSTGGAIDVWLYANGQASDLGVPFDWMDVEAGAFFHLKVRRKKFPNDQVVCSNRSILLHAMVKAGFSCYPHEFWHFNYGNQMDALVKRGTARYSYAELPETVNP